MTWCFCLSDFWVAFAEVVGRGLGVFIGRRLGVDSGLFSVEYLGIYGWLLRCCWGKKGLLIYRLKVWFLWYVVHTTILSPVIRRC